MNHIVPIDEKKHFLEWFLESYELRRKECLWLLTYLLSEDELLEKVRFVDEISSSTRTIFMSTTCVKETAFRFTKKKLVTTDVERALHDIRLHPDEEMYIVLSFKSSKACPKYAAVREVEPMEKYKLTSNSLYSLLAEMVLDEAIEKYQKEKLYEQINQSLEAQDKERFLLLSERWRELHTK